MSKSMRILMLFLFMAGFVCGEELPVTEKASEEVVASAVDSVKELGKQVVLGKYEVAAERMYPVWKERMAKREGGMEKLQKKLDDVPNLLLKQGISITDFKPVGEPIAYEVYPGKVVLEGEKTERLRYTKWMILVPTVTRYRIMVKDEPAAVILESKGFQVAISDKGSDTWTFIDGSSLSVSDLRSLFITLPEDMVLPALERKQVK